MDLCKEYFQWSLLFILAHGLMGKCRETQTKRAWDDALEQAWLTDEVLRAFRSPCKCFKVRDEEMML